MNINPVIFDFLFFSSLLYGDPPIAVLGDVVLPHINVVDVDAVIFVACGGGAPVSTASVV